jgi:hypothetical protein
MTDTELGLLLLAGGTAVGLIALAVLYATLSDDHRRLARRVAELERAVEGDDDDSGCRCIYCGELVADGRECAGCGCEWGVDWRGE